MKRFLIFICLFPGLAVAGLFAFVSIGTGALPDNPEAVLVGWGYVVGMVPALILALMDRFSGKTRAQRVIANDAPTWRYVGHVKLPQLRLAARCRQVSPHRLLDHPLQ
jgi:hypothetical protein